MVALAPAAQPQPQAVTQAVTLTLEIDPAGLDALRRSLGLGRARPIRLTWHDRHGCLAQGGVAVVALHLGRLTTWRTEARSAAVGAPPAILAEAAALAGLHGIELPDGGALDVVQTLRGRVRTGMVGPVALHQIDGALDNNPGARLVRLLLSGPAEAVAEMAAPLVPGARVATRSLSAEALALAGVAVPPCPLGAPTLGTGLAPGAAFAAAASHLLGVLLHHAPRAAAGETGEAVHQMRVALRRLRALLGVFGAVIACPEVTSLRPALKSLAGALGPARDWDVFLSGTGRAVGAAFADTPEVAGLLDAATVRRAAAYGALAGLLAGPALHETALRVAILAQAQPWGADGVSTDGVSTDGGGDTAAFGADLLARRWRRLVRRGKHLDTMPEAGLHALRIEAKRLRYAAEVFAPLFPGRPTRRFLKRLAALQEALGLLNDGVVAAELMQELAPAGGDGLAGGMVRGFVAANAAGARQAIARRFKRLRKVGVFPG